MTSAIAAAILSDLRRADEMHAGENALTFRHACLLLAGFYTNDHWYSYYDLQIIEKTAENCADEVLAAHSAVAPNELVVRASLKFSCPDDAGDDEAGNDERTYRRDGHALDKRCDVVFTDIFDESIDFYLRVKPALCEVARTLLAAVRAGALTCDDDTLDEAVVPAEIRAALEAARAPARVDARTFAPAPLCACGTCARSNKQLQDWNLVANMSCCHRKAAKKPNDDFCWRCGVPLWSVRR
jgi:hypothetical protein